MLRSGSAAPSASSELGALEEREHVFGSGQKAALDERRFHGVGGGESRSRPDERGFMWKTIELAWYPPALSMG